MAGQATDSIIVAQASASGSPAASATTGAATAAGQAAQAANAAGQTATTQAVAESPIGFPPFDATTFGSQILWLLICFGVLYLVVSRAVVPRVGGILTARRDKIEGDLAEADRLRQATDKAIADYEAALAAARSKAHGIAQETRDTNKTGLDAKRAAVEADLSQKVAAAESSIQRAKTEALGKVDEIAADTAAALVGRLTGGVSPEEARAAVASVVKG